MSNNVVGLLVVIDVGLIWKEWLFGMIVCSMYTFLMLSVSPCYHYCKCFVPCLVSISSISVPIISDEH